MTDAESTIAAINTAHAVNMAAMNYCEAPTAAEIAAAIQHLANLPGFNEHSDKQEAIQEAFETLTGIH